MATGASAQTTASAQITAAWHKVEALKPGKNIRLTTTAGTHLSCAFKSASDDSITCGSVTFPRAEIKSVKLPRRGLSGGLGFAIGFVGGIAIELEAFNAGWNDQASGATVLAIGIVGAAVLITIPILAIVYDWFGSTIYTAPEKVAP
jgi:hypothetical protein